MIGAQQECAQIVRLAGEFMQQQRLANVAAVDELVELAVRIAGDVPQHGVSRGFRLEPMDRHDREQLLDRPAIGHRLKEREIAENGVRHRGVEVLQILGNEIDFGDQLANLGAHRPEIRFGKRALLQRHVTEVEERDRHFDRLLGDVIGLQCGASGHGRVSFRQRLQRMRVVLVGAQGRGRFVGQRRNAQDAEDQHAVVSRHGPAAFRDDDGVRRVLVVANRLDVGHHVVGVFLERIVDARLEIGPRSIVVDPESASDIEILHAGAASVQFAVDATGLDQRILDEADVRNLAAEVEVQQLQTVGHAARLKMVQQSQDFAGRQPELRAVSSGGLPATGTAGREFGSHANRWPHAHSLGYSQDEVHLGVLFYDRNHRASDLLGEHRHLDELAILEAVADDRRAFVGHRDDRQ